MGVQEPNERDAFFNRLYEKEFRKMWKYALTILKDPVFAEEVVQDAFVEVLLNIDMLMTWEKPEYWLRKTVKFKALHIHKDRMRSMRRLVRLNDDIPGPDMLGQVETGNVAELKRKIIQELSEDDLNLLRRSMRKDKTYKDMARETGRSVACCQKRIQRIRARLAKIL